MFRGCMRIVVTQWGKIEASPDLDFEPRVRDLHSFIGLPDIKLGKRNQLHR